MASEILASPSDVLQETTRQPAITREQAVHKANGYLTMHVGMFFRAEEAVYLPLERPVWQVLVHFHMYDIGPFKVSLLDVDAITGEVIPFSDTQVQSILERADAFVTTRTSTAAPPF